jgi:hypothetical protein
LNSFSPQVLRAVINFSQFFLYLGNSLVNQVLIGFDGYELDSATRTLEREQPDSIGPKTFDLPFFPAGGETGDHFPAEWE